jgi:hypothetical protein
MMTARTTNIIDRIAGIVWPVAIAAFAAVLCLEAAALVAVAPEVVREAQGATDVLFVIIPFPTAVAEIGGDAMVGLFIFYAVAIVISIAWLLRDWRVAGRGFHESLQDRIPVPERSQVGLALQLLCVMILASIAWYMALAMAGVETSTPAFDEMDRWELGYSFAMASVYEELITRVLYIGIPMALIALSRHRPGWWKLFLGGKENLDHLDWVLIAASGLAFGLAHAPGWDFWKVPPTLVSGLAFGYLFAKKGLAPAIVVHFAIDYTSMPYEVFGFSTMEYVMTIFLLGASFVGLYFAARFASEAMSSTAKPAPAPAYWPGPPSFQAVHPGGSPSHAPGPAPSADGKPAAASPPRSSLNSRFVCVACGGAEATYADSALKCIKCGQVYKYL